MTDPPPNSTIPSHSSTTISRVPPTKAPSSTKPSQVEMEVSPAPAQFFRVVTSDCIEVGVRGVVASPALARLLATLPPGEVASLSVVATAATVVELLAGQRAGQGHQLQQLLGLEEEEAREEGVVVEKSYRVGMVEQWGGVEQEEIFELEEIVEGDEILEQEEILEQDEIVEQEEIVVQGKIVEQEEGVEEEEIVILDDIVETDEDIVGQLEKVKQKQGLKMDQDQILEERFVMELAAECSKEERAVALAALLAPGRNWRVCSPPREAGRVCSPPSTLARERGMVCSPPREGGRTGETTDWQDARAFLQGEEQGGGELCGDVEVDKDNHDEEEEFGIFDSPAHESDRQDDDLEDVEGDGLAEESKVERGVSVVYTGLDDTLLDPSEATHVTLADDDDSLALGDSIDPEEIVMEDVDVEEDVLKTPLRTNPVEALSRSSLDSFQARMKSRTHKARHSTQSLRKSSSKKPRGGHGLVQALPRTSSLAPGTACRLVQALFRTSSLSKTISEIPAAGPVASTPNNTRVAISFDETQEEEAATREDVATAAATFVVRKSLRLEFVSSRGVTKIKDIRRIRKGCKRKRW